MVHGSKFSLLFTHNSASQLTTWTAPDVLDATCKPSRHHCLTARPEERLQGAEVWSHSSRCSRCCLGSLASTLTFGNIAPTVKQDVVHAQHEQRHVGQPATKCLERHQLPHVVPQLSLSYPSSETKATIFPRSTRSPPPSFVQEGPTILLFISAVAAFPQQVPCKPCGPRLAIIMCVWPLLVPSFFCRCCIIRKGQGVARMRTLTGDRGHFAIFLLYTRYSVAIHLPFPPSKLLRSIACL